MKSVYDENDRYGVDANRLDQATHQLLKPLFEEWVKNGFSVRQISHVMQGSVIDLELTHMLDQEQHR